MISVAPSGSIRSRTRFPCSACRVCVATAKNLRRCSTPPRNPSTSEARSRPGLVARRTCANDEQRRDHRRRRIASANARRARHLDALIEPHPHRRANRRLDAKATGCCAFAADAIDDGTRERDRNAYPRVRLVRGAGQNPYGSSAGVVRSGGASESGRAGEAATMRRNCAGEERLHVFRTRVQRRVARANDFLFGRDGDDILHPA